MRIEEFASEVIEILQQRFANMFGSAEFAVQRVNKPGNVVLTGIRIRMRNSVIAPVFYVDNYLNAGRSSLDMAKSIVDNIEEANASAPVGAEWITTWSSASQYIVPRLIDSRKNRNEDYLKDRVKKRLVQGIAVIYDVLLPVDMADGSAVVPVTRQLMDIWHAHPCQIHSRALENGPRLRPVLYDSLANVMAKMMGLPFTPEDMDTPAMDVLSNSDSHFGASAILYPGVKDMLWKKYPGGFHILPSSVHELLILPKDPDIPVNCLQEMVMSVNDTEVDPEDQLSDSIYTLDTEGNLVVVEGR